MPVIIAPSLLASDFANLGAEANAVAGAADWLHVDVMDNHFVPNLTIGLPVVQSLLKATDLPFDCHLMIEAPERWALGYAEAGAYNVTFHVEAAADPVALAADLRAAGTQGRAGDRPGHAGRAVPGDPAALRHAPDHDDQGRLRRPVVHPGAAGQGADRARGMSTPATWSCGSRSTAGSTRTPSATAAAAGADAFVAGTAVYGAE